MKAECDLLLLPSSICYKGVFVQHFVYILLFTITCSSTMCRKTSLPFYCNNG